MNVERADKNILAVLAGTLFEPAEALQEKIDLGTVAYVTSKFQQDVAMKLGPKAFELLTDFYKKYLGIYRFVCISNPAVDNVYSLRLVNMVSDNGFANTPAIDGMEGVEIEFKYHGPQRKYVMSFYRVQCVQGITSRKLEITHTL